MEGLSVSADALIGGIAIDPAVVQGKDPSESIKAVLSSAEAMNVSETLPQAVVKPPQAQGEQKKRRGRPRKNPLPETKVGSGIPPAVPVIKKGRGRPKKVRLVEPAIVANEPVNLDHVPPPVLPRISAIDLLAENLMKSGQRHLKEAAAPVGKRPVGRPRKRPLGATPTLSVPVAKKSTESGEKKGKETGYNIGGVAITSDDIAVGEMLLSKLETEQSKAAAYPTAATTQDSALPSEPAAPEPAAPEPPVTAPKKKRGRPRKRRSTSPVADTAAPPPKAETPQTNSTVSAKNDTLQTTDQPVVKKRGRPPKKKPTTQPSDKPEVPPVKRKPGRPRKNPLPVPTTSTPPLTVPEADAATEDVPVRVQACDSPNKPPPRPRGRPRKEKPQPQVVMVSASEEEADPDIMGKLQVSFSESESDCSDPMEVDRSAIAALTNRVAPPVMAVSSSSSSMTPLVTSSPRGGSPLHLGNKFEESFDEDSDN